MRLLPDSLRNLEWLDIELLPPGGLVAGLMQLTVMTSAERNGEFIAHLQPDGSGLGETQVMRVRRRPATDEAGLRGDELEMGFVAQPLGLSEGKKVFVDGCRHYGR